MAAASEEANRRTSIANLLHPSADVAEKNLLSLSHLAASMRPVSPDARRRRPDMSRTRSVPPQHHLPDDMRRAGFRANHPTHLGVSHPSGKRLSRTKSGFAAHAAKAALAEHPASLPALTDVPDVSDAVHSAVLRPISSNPISGAAAPSFSTKHTVESRHAKIIAGADRGAGVFSPLHAANKRHAFQMAAHRFAEREQHIGFTTGGGGSGVMMDADYEQLEPSCSSHDAKLHSRPSRPRTTPDAKRAQNRESAKRFRVAQKKRWAELHHTLNQKDEEISKLKDMLQQVTNHKLASSHSTKPEAGVVETRRATQPGSDQPSTQPSDALAVAELDMFVKLMISPKDEDVNNSSTGISSSSPLPCPPTQGTQVDLKLNPPPPPLAANIGCLYRVIVAKLDGSVLGIRHENTSCPQRAMGGEVGGCLWQHVHSSDSAHLRFTVVHAPKMASVMGGEPSVFSYRRRQFIADVEEGDKTPYVRMKGCVYPLADDQGVISTVLLAEFIEL